VTLIIVAITCLVSLLALRDQRIMRSLWFEPFVIKARGERHRFLTHAFVHASSMHLFVNMFVLWMFGRNVEALYGGLLNGTGPIAYAVLYLGGILFSTLPGFRKHIYDPNYRAVGASGAVAAVLFAHILMKPREELYMFFIPFPLPSYLFGILYLAFEWYQDKRGGDNVAHDAHFYGALFGTAFTAILEPGLVTQFVRAVIPAGLLP